MKRLLVGGAVLALGISSMGLAQAQSGFKVTGGGQALTQAGAENGVKGPGDTYGFNAQDTDGDEGNEAKGQFNSIQRTAGAPTAKGQGEHIKGEVTCLIATTSPDDSQGAARFGGVVRNSEFVDEETEGNPDYVDRFIFVVDVTDNGEGKDNDDLIYFERLEEDADNDGEPDSETPCDMERTLQEGETVLARGNVQVHNYTAPE